MLQDLSQVSPHQIDALKRTPEALFSRIITRFRELGILGRALSLEHDGVRYTIVCDENAFIVYRVNVHSGSRHHMPGWPVCLVNSVTIFEECYSPGLGRDHFACGLDVETWLEMVGNHCRNSSDL
jgi:hypothetical protein